MTDDIRFITADEAVAAAEACAFRDHDRNIIHCFTGGIGAEWDLAEVIDCIRRARVHDGIPQIAYVNTLFGRCLVVIEGMPDRVGGPPTGRRRVFDTITEQEPT